MYTYQYMHSQGLFIYSAVQWYSASQNCLFCVLFYKFCFRCHSLDKGSRLWCPVTWGDSTASCHQGFPGNRWFISCRFGCFNLIFSILTLTFHGILIKFCPLPIFTYLCKFLNFQTVTRYLSFHIFNFFSRNAGLISTLFSAKHSWLKVFHDQRKDILFSNGEIMRK